jgi:ketosteroid isomerase-like protein
MAGKRVPFESVLSPISSLEEPFAGRTEHGTVFKLPHPTVPGDGLHKELALSVPIVRHRSMHSHRIGALLVCLLAAAISSSAQEKSDAATIRALERKWTESYKQHNIDILSSLLAEDFVITIEDGSTFSKAGYISHSADPATKVQVAELSDLKVRMHGDTAVVTGAYHEKGESNGKPYEYHDRLTDIWMKVGGKWQVVASQYSVPSK